MSELVDLTVNGWCEAIYAMQAEVEEARAPDDVSRGDYHALAAAIKDLYAVVAEKINREAAARAETGS
jgi:hypothetical protein